MNEPVIEEQNLIALRRYLYFLSTLPGLLENIRSRSDEYQKSGHKLLSPPDIQALTRNAASNESHWRATVVLVPALGIMGNRIVEQTYNFLQEFERALKKLPPSALTTLLNSFPHQNFTAITSGTHETLNHSGIIDLINNLCSLVQECIFTANSFDKILMEDSNTTHSFFSHFIDSLLTPICLCHPSVSKFSIYFNDGLLSSAFTQPQLAKALEPISTTEKHDLYLTTLRDLHVSARIAGSNLGFLCSRMLLFLNKIEAGLKSNTLQTSVRLANTSFIQIKSLLGGLKETSHALATLSSALHL